ncbi:MAG: TAXI family TRAP transporter solute-binding subunit [Chloroflexota bacterium]
MFPACSCDAASALTRLTDLEGLSISVGEVGSGVYPLATALLEQNGISEDNATYVNLGSADAASQLQAGNIDAIFLVISARSDLMLELLRDESVELMNLSRAAAYRSYFPYLTDVIIPQGALDLIDNIPNEDITLLSTTATLVVRDDTPEDYILLLLPHIIELHRQPGVLELAEDFPNTRYVELPINVAADRYYRQGPSFLSNYLSPVWASVIDRLIILLIPVLTLLYPLFRGIPPVYRFGIRYTLLQWYAKLKEIDTNIHDLSQKELLDRMEEIDALETDIFNRTDVPNGYLDELYSLVEHIGLVYVRLQKEYNRRIEAGEIAEETMS